MTQGSLWQLEDHGRERLHEIPQSWYQVKSHPVIPPQVRLLRQAQLFVVNQLLSCVWLFGTPCTAARQASLSSTGFWSLQKLVSIELMMPSTLSSSISPFSSCLQSFPASGSFPMSWLFASGGQSIGAWAPAPVLPMNSQGWFPLGLIDLISLQSEGLSRVFCNTAIWKHQFFNAQPSLWKDGTSNLQRHDLRMFLFWYRSLELAKIIP